MTEVAKYYTGIGSRETPDSILSLFNDIVFQLAGLGYTLRSGGADGADTAFEEGCSEKMTIGFSKTNRSGCSCKKE